VAAAVARRPRRVSALATEKVGFDVRTVAVVAAPLLTVGRSA